ncbi:MAG: hypothetical protein KA793_05985, partial [Bacteroidales bacterium]|nr:hypothetical protein [Bacteroidales bacterium]
MIKKSLKLIVTIVYLFVGYSLFADNITPVRTDVSGFSDWTDTNVAGTTYLQLLVSGANTVSPAMDFNNYTGETLNFKARTYGGVDATENTITVSISTDNGSNWTVLGTRTPANKTLTAMAAFDLSAYSGSQVKIKFSVAGTNNGIGAGIDDITITGTPSAGTPEITISTSSISGFTYIFGNGPSIPQNFTVSGSNLTGNISVNPPTNYEISQSSG